MKTVSNKMFSLAILVLSLSYTVLVGASAQYVTEQNLLDQYDLNQSFVPRDLTEKQVRADGMVNYPLISDEWLIPKALKSQSQGRSESRSFDKLDYPDTSLPISLDALGFNAVGDTRPINYQTNSMDPDYHPLWDSVIGKGEDGRDLIRITDSDDIWIPGYATFSMHGKVLDEDANVMDGLVPADYHRLSDDIDPALQDSWISTALYELRSAVALDLDGDGREEAIEIKIGPEPRAPNLEGFLLIQTYVNTAEAGSGSIKTKSKYTASPKFQGVELSPLPPTTDFRYAGGHIHVGGGDLDGDGYRREIVVSHVSYTWILRFVPGSGDGFWSESHWEVVYGGVSGARLAGDRSAYTRGLAVANLDGAGPDEIVVARFDHPGRLHGFEQKLDDRSCCKSVVDVYQLHNPSGEWSVRWLNGRELGQKLYNVDFRRFVVDALNVGDIDGDGKPEILYGGRADTYLRYHTRFPRRGYYYRIREDNDTVVGALTVNTDGQGGWSITEPITPVEFKDNHLQNGGDLSSWDIVAANLSGGTAPVDIFYGNHIVHLKTNNQHEQWLEMHKEIRHNEPWATMRRYIVGDFITHEDEMGPEGVIRDEIITLNFYPSSASGGNNTNHITGFSILYQEPQEPQEFNNEYRLDGYHFSPEKQFYVKGIPYLVGVNFRDDEIAGYLDSHSVKYVEPTILNVLAAPPFYEGQSNNSLGRTSYGSIYSEGTHEEDLSGGYLDIEVGLRFKFEIPILGIDLYENSLGIKQLLEWNKSTVKRNIVTQDLRHFSQHNEDTYVVATMPVDVYTYTEAGNPDSTFSYQFPRQFLRTRFVRSYLENYQSNYPDSGMMDLDLLKRLMGHREGHPASYMSRWKANELLSLSGDSAVAALQESSTQGEFSFSHQTTGVSDSYSLVRVNKTASLRELNRFHGATGLQTHFATGNAYARAGAGFTYGNNWGTLFSETSLIEGRVADIPYADIESGKFDASYLYDWGVVGYKLNLARYGYNYGYNPTIITYWTHGATRLPGSHHSIYTDEDQYAGYENVVLQGVASQSSTLDSSSMATKAIDGVIGYNSRSMTFQETDPWWKVDLGQQYPIELIELYIDPTSCEGCIERTTGIEVQISNNANFSPDDSLYSTGVNIRPVDGVLRYHLKHADGNYVSGRYVRVIRRGASTSLVLSEVKVYASEGDEAMENPNPGCPFIVGGGTSDRPNLALGRPASQSSNRNGASGPAGKAVDGNRSGIGVRCYQITHTEWEADPWWQIDLGSAKTIDQVTLFNRTDCCEGRLTNFRVGVSNNADMSGATWTPYQPALTGSSIELNIPNVTGRYVRVMIDNQHAVLSLAEVEIYGSDPILSNSDSSENAPSEDASNEDASNEDASNEDAPNEDAPNEDAPNEDAPSEDAPSEDAPSEDAPSEDAPNEDASNEDAPNEDAPNEDAPSEDAPSEDAPSEDAPNEDVSNEDASSESTSGEDDASSSNSTIGVTLPQNPEDCEVIAGGDTSERPNIALNLNAIQSSFDGSEDTANNANDGNRSGSEACQQITRTDLQDRPWWKIDLGSSKSLDEVRLFLPDGCCSGAAANYKKYRVTLSERADFALGTWFPHSYRRQDDYDQNALRFNMQGFRGRYLMVTIFGGPAALSLAEVEVYEIAKEDTSNEDASNEDASNEDAPSEDAPNEDAPNEDAPNEDAPNEDAPNEDAPNEDAPNEDAPNEDAPNEDAPNEDAPNEDAPNEDAPNEDVSNEDASSESTSGEDDASSSNSTIGVTLPQNPEDCEVIAGGDTSERPNIALNLNAIQSSFDGSEDTANNANDGNRSGSEACQQITRTDLQDRPWWKIDLGSSKSLDEVRLFFPDGCCSGAAANYKKYKVMLSERADFALGTRFPHSYRRQDDYDQNALRFNMQGVRGRYLMVTIFGGPAALSLAEVEVYEMAN